METTAITPRLLDAAIAGRVHLGLYAVSEQGTSKFTCWDLDDDARWPNLVALAEHLAPPGHILLERSRRGGHLFAFHQPTSWEQAHAYGVDLAQRFGLEDIEVVPKHGGLHCMRLPGSKHPKTGEVYPIIDPLTGEILELQTALERITPITLPHIELPKPVSVAPRPRPTNGSTPLDSPATFDDLVRELEHLTELRIYGPEKAVGCCPWHEDKHPSLLVKDQRFHCLSPRCQVWGDANDVRRFIARGIEPPRG